MAEIRFALRRLRQSPAYAMSIIATLALTLGACTAVYSAVQAILLRTDAIASPEQLVVFWGADPARNLPVVELSYQNFADWTARSRSFAQAAAMGSSAWPTILESAGTPARVSAAGVSASFYATLQVGAALGRVLRPDDDIPNAPRVIVISHRLWRQRFGAGADAIGRVVRVAGGPHTIVGVMPADFDFPRGTDVWMPVVPVLAATPAGWNDHGLRNVGVLYVIGRLRPEATPLAAAGELERRASASASDAPRFGTRLVMTSLAEYLFGPTRRVLWLLCASVVVLLLIGCSNIASLMLTRASERELEYGVRLALGASAGAVARSWVVEAGLLSAAGGVAGLFVAWWLVRMIVGLAPANLRHVEDVAVDGGVIAFSMAVTLLTGLLCACFPARRAATTSPAESLRGSGRVTAGVRTVRARAMLVTAQVALVVVLLIAAGLVQRSFLNLQRANLGFVPDGVISLNVTPRSISGPTNVWMAHLVERLRSLPSVDAAGAIFLRPLSHGPIGQEASVVLEGQDPDDPRLGNPLLNYQVATPGYFDTMRIPLRRGRVFSVDDIEGARAVAMVSAGAAARLWPGQDAIGRRLLLPAFSPQEAGPIWRTVVGVVASVRYRGLDDERFDVYVPASRDRQTASDIVVRGTGDAGALAAAVQAEVRRLDPEAVIDGVVRMEDVVRQARAPWALGAWMFGVFAALALVLAAVGLTGLLSLEVTQRQHEFAVRQALGADRADVVRRVVSRAAWRVALGTSAGLLAAGLGSRFLGSLLYEVDAGDPVTYAIVTAVVLLIALVATVVPARRAASLSPSTLLR